MKNKKSKFSKKIPAEKKAFGWTLQFRDKSLEDCFNMDKLAYQSNVSLFSNTFLIVFSMILWILDKDPFRLQALLFNIIKIPAILLYLFLRKKYPKKMELSIIMIMLPFCCMTIENVSSGSGTTNTNLNSYLNGLYQEEFCILWLLLKINWRRTAIILLIINGFISFRYFDIKTNLENNMRPLQVCIANFLFHLMFAYVMEKNQRISFYEKKRKERSPLFFQNFIKESLPLGVIVLKKNEVLFCNHESKRLLGIEGRDFALDDLKLLELEEKDLYLDLVSERSMEPRSNVLKSSLLNYVKSFAYTGRRSTNNFTAQIAMPNNEKKVQKFNVKISKIIWKEEFATIITLSEDLTLVKLEYLRDFDIFKDRVLASVSHQFRTPLNAVMGILENINETTTDSSTKESLELAKTSSQRLLSIIDDILDFSQINLGKFSLKIAKFSLESFFEEIKLTFGPEAKKKGIDFLVVNETTDFNLHNRKNYFNNDENRLKQVLFNLLSNSFRLTTKGFVKVTYELMPLNSIKYISQLKISVEDSGCGIKESLQAKLFEFFGKIQEREYKGLNTEGIGFGLAISQKLLILMNNNELDGQINVSSILDKGSTFSFVIRSFNDTAQPPNTPSNELCQVNEIMSDDLPVETILNYNLTYSKSMRVDTTSEFLPKIKRKKKILVVDDDKINIMVLSCYLNSSSEYEYITAYNGQEALAIIEDEASAGENFDLVLMDCNMPIMDGYEATARIREMIERKIIPDIPVIAITANVLLSDLEKCLEYGMSDYMTKPFTKLQLLSKIKKYL